MNEFDVSAVKRSGCQVVTLRGDLDGDTAPLLDDALDQLSRREKVIVDLSRLDVLTSAGMQSLLRERRFGRPTLACPDGLFKSLDMDATVTRPWLSHRVRNCVRDRFRE